MKNFFEKKDMKDKAAKKSVVFAALLSAVLIITDQIIKYIIKSNMAVGEHISLIKDVFEIRYVTNTGTAWSLLSGHVWLLAAISIVIMLVLVMLYRNLLCSPIYRPLRICLIFIFSGAAGNLIDRIFLHEVIDYLYFKLIDFPIFNFADMCVSVTVFVAAAFILFKYSGNDFDVLLGEKILTPEGEYIVKRAKGVRSSDE